MKRHLDLDTALVAVVVALVAGIVIGTSFARGATSPSAPEPEPPWQPVPIVVQREEVSTTTPDYTVPMTLPAAPSSESTNAPVANVSEPASSVSSARATAPGTSVTGSASWFCSATSPCTRGFPASGAFAAAGPALRVGAWRGRYVTAMANGHSVRIQLVDFCQCSGGRVIDLYASVVTALGLSLSRGVYSVQISW